MPTEQVAPSGQKFGSAAASRRISDFIKVASASFGRHRSDIAIKVSAALQTADLGTQVLPPASHPASMVMEGLISAPEDDLTRLLGKCAADLHWRTAGFGKLPEQAAQKLAVVELAGPIGMFRMGHIRFGLLIQDKGFQYPKHWHAAEELYYVIAGTASWAVDDEALTPQPPGSFVHHKSMQPHRMNTEAEPMLALWAWAGNIESTSYSI